MTNEGLYPMQIHDAQLPIGLSERHILAIVLFRIDGLTQEQVAKKMKVSQQWVSELVRQSDKIITDAGLELPANRPSRRMLSCTNEYLDGLEKQKSGMYKKRRGNSASENDAHYRPWR